MLNFRFQALSDPFRICIVCISKTTSVYRDHFSDLILISNFKFLNDIVYLTWHWCILVLLVQVVLEFHKKKNLLVSLSYTTLKTLTPNSSSILPQIPKLLLFSSFRILFLRISKSTAVYQQSRTKGDPNSKC